MSPKAIESALYVRGGAVLGSQLVEDPGPWGRPIVPSWGAQRTVGLANLTFELAI